SLKSNEIWQSDHYHMDTICRVGEKINTQSGEVVPQYGRPWLTTWIDIRSRKILAFKIRATDPDSAVILDPFGRAFEAHGVPESVYTDNGKDYLSRLFTGRTKAQRIKERMSGSDVEPVIIENAGIYKALGVQHIRAGKYNARAKLVE